MATKPCSRCKIEKPLDAFTADKRAALGRQPQCKVCRAALVKEQRDADPEVHRAALRANYQNHRERYLLERAAVRDADRAKYRATARESYQRNKAKHIAAVLRNRRENPERVRAYSSRRRAIVKGGATGKETQAWIKEQKKACYWCGVACARSFHVDHYVALSRGGAHILPNLVIACPSCNLKKHAKDPLDFAREVGRLL